MPFAYDIVVEFFIHPGACMFACRFHCPVEFPGLLSWVLSQPGLKIFRAMIIMARGHYEHTPWSSNGDYIVAPSIYGY